MIIQYSWNFHTTFIYNYHSMLQLLNIKSTPKFIIVISTLIRCIDVIVKRFELIMKYFL